MTAIAVTGGVYHERCIWPDWDHFYGSAGRAAAAISGHVDEVVLHSYARPDTASKFRLYAEMYGFAFVPTSADQTISFEYVHCLSVPAIRPARARIRANPMISISAEVVLRFAMMEGSACVHANRCVYDPQSAFEAEAFGANGSTATHLAIVGNRSEVLALGGGLDPIDAAKSLVSKGAEVVVVKAGIAGADVVDSSGVVHVPAYRTDRVWTIGSGDVFAAMFAALWGVNGAPAVDAARIASRAVATYVNSMGLPIPPVGRLGEFPEIGKIEGSVYLASPFFTIGQRWLVDESRRHLHQFGLDVFSPVHDVGPGPAEEVAPADLKALDESDVVFAILDGLDSGTLFEVGYALARGKPVYCLAQTVSDEDLKMVVGSGCHVHDDFVTALHHVAWRS